MPVFTAAVAAVTAAVATTTVATVATAAIAVSAAVGTVGLGLSVVAAVTGDQTLGKVGKWMGLAGAVGGLAGIAAGGVEAASAYGEMLTDAWDEGIGSFLSGGGEVTGGTAEISQAASQTTTAGESAGLIAPASNQTVAGQAAGVGQPAASTLSGPQTLAPVSGTAPGSTFGATPASTLGTQAAQQAAKVGATTPAAANPALQQGAGHVAALATQATPTGGMEWQKGLGAAGSTYDPASNTFRAGTKAFDTSKPNWWSDLSAADKLVIASSVAGPVAGGLEGVFANMSANERLEFDKMVNAQNQQQRELQNQRAGYAPRIQFAKPSGLMNAPRV